MSLQSKIVKKVAVLTGGSSYEREFSLLSGQYVCNALDSVGIQAVPLDTTSNLVETLLNEQVDAVYNALHGKNGEDGTVQSLLDLLNIPYVGSKVGGCTLTWNKNTLPELLESAKTNGLVKSELIPADLSQEQLFESVTYAKRLLFTAEALKDFGETQAVSRSFAYLGDLPYMVRPLHGGSAQGVVKVDKQADLGPALLEALSYDSSVIVDRFIDGVELAVCLYENAAGELIALPPVEVKSQTGFYDAEARFDAELSTKYSPPLDADVSAQELELAIAAAKILHIACGLRDISRVDLIVSAGKAFLLDAKVSPGLTERSLYPLALEAAGLNAGEFFKQLLQNAVDSFQNDK